MFTYCSKGFALAITEACGGIPAAYLPSSTDEISTGTVAAGYQNFLICVEMVFAAIGLLFAFPYRPYAIQQSGTSTSVSFYNNSPIRTGQSSAAGSSFSLHLHTISHNLKETMNPRDIIQDSIHNFHPQYKNYEQYADNSGSRQSGNFPATTPTRIDFDAFTGDKREKEVFRPPEKSFSEKTRIIETDEH